MKVILGKRITTLLFAIVMMLVTFVVDAAELKIVYPENGLYSLQPMCAPSKELTVHNASTTNGANVIIWDINSNWHTQPSHQKWYVLRIGNTEWYKILAENSGSALNIHNGIAANGTNVSIWPFGGNMHKFRFLNAGNGYYVLQGHVNGAYVLDVSGASNTNGANVQIYQFNNSGAQKWKLVQRYKRWSGYAKKTLKAYKDYQLRSQHASYERVDKGDLLVVLNEKGGAYFVQYKTSNGSTKERWVSKEVFKEIKPYNNSSIYQPTQSINIQDNSSTAKYWESMVGKKISINLNSEYYKPQVYSKNPFKKSYPGHPTNCTWYAIGRFAEVNGQWLGVTGMPYEWVSQAKAKGFAVGTIPRSKCVGASSKHVYFVEFVNGNDIYTTEVNVGGSGNTTKHDYVVRKRSLSELNSSSLYKNSQFIYPK